MSPSETGFDCNGMPTVRMALAAIVAPSASLRRALIRGKWKAQYCTTNYVSMSRRFVLKKYMSRNNFQIESAVYKQRARFSFEMSRLIDSIDDPDAGMWNIFQRLPGRTMHESLPPKGRAPSLVDAVVDALASFEETAQGLTGIGFREWTLMDGLAPLVSSCCDRGFPAAAEALFELSNEAERALQSVPRVPCFDLFLRNIIWRPVGTGISVAYIDFDKADRLVWAGEQLSHLSTHPATRPYLDQALKRYAAASGMDGDLLAHICEVGQFFRALAGIRDSAPRTGGSETTANAAARKQAHKELLRLAEATAPALVSRIGLGRAWLRRLSSALADIEFMASP